MKALDQLKTHERPHQSGVLEMDDLLQFLSQKDLEQERLIGSLEQRRQAALYEKENLRHEYEEAQSRFDAVQSSYEAAQKEVSRLAYSRSQEVDPDDYAQFLSGMNPLTLSERKIFNYYLEGRTVQDIIMLSDIKESTLRFHNRNIYLRLIPDKKSNGICKKAFGRIQPDRKNNRRKMRI